MNKSDKKFTLKLFKIKNGNINLLKNRITHFSIHNKCIHLVLCNNSLIKYYLESNELSHVDFYNKKTTNSKAEIRSMFFDNKCYHGFICLANKEYIYVHFEYNIVLNLAKLKKYNISSVCFNDSNEVKNTAPFLVATKDGEILEMSINNRTKSSREHEVIFSNSQLSILDISMINLDISNQPSFTENTNDDNMLSIIYFTTCNSLHEISYTYKSTSVNNPTERSETYAQETRIKTNTENLNMNQPRDETKVYECCIDSLTSILKIENIRNRNYLFWLNGCCIFISKINNCKGGKTSNRASRANCANRVKDYLSSGSNWNPNQDGNNLEEPTLLSCSPESDTSLDGINLASFSEEDQEEEMNAAKRYKRAVHKSTESPNRKKNAQTKGTYRSNHPYRKSSEPEKENKTKEMNKKDKLMSEWYLDSNYVIVNFLDLNILTSENANNFAFTKSFYESLYCQKGNTNVLASHIEDLPTEQEATEPVLTTPEPKLYENTVSAVVDMCVSELYIFLLLEEKLIIVHSGNLKKIFEQALAIETYGDVIRIMKDNSDDQVWLCTSKYIFKIVVNKKKGEGFYLNEYTQPDDCEMEYANLKTNLRKKNLSKILESCTNSERIKIKKYILKSNKYQIDQFKNLHISTEEMLISFLHKRQYFLLASHLYNNIHCYNNVVKIVFFIWLIQLYSYSLDLYMHLYLITRCSFARRQLQNGANVGTHSGEQSSGTSDQPCGTSDQSSVDSDQPGGTSDQSSVDSDQLGGTSDQSSVDSDQTTETSDPPSGTSDELSGTDSKCAAQLGPSDEAESGATPHPRDRPSDHSEAATDPSHDELSGKNSQSVYETEVNKANEAKKANMAKRKEKTHSKETGAHASAEAGEDVIATEATLNNTEGGNSNIGNHQYTNNAEKQQKGITNVRKNNVESAIQNDKYLRIGKKSFIRFFQKIIEKDERNDLKYSFDFSKGKKMNIKTLTQSDNFYVLLKIYKMKNVEIFNFLKAQKELILADLERYRRIFVEGEEHLAGKERRTKKRGISPTAPLTSEEEQTATMPKTATTPPISTTLPASTTPPTWRADRVKRKLYRDIYAYKCLEASVYMIILLKHFKTFFQLNDVIAQILENFNKTNFILLFKFMCNDYNYIINFYINSNKFTALFNVMLLFPQNVLLDVLKNYAFILYLHKPQRYVDMLIFYDNLIDDYADVIVCMFVIIYFFKGSEVAKRGDISDENGGGDHHDNLGDGDHEQGHRDDQRQDDRSGHPTGQKHTDECIRFLEYIANKIIEENTLTERENYMYTFECTWKKNHVINCLLILYIEKEEDGKIKNFLNRLKSSGIHFDYLFIIRFLKEKKKENFIPHFYIIMKYFEEAVDKSLELGDYKTAQNAVILCEDEEEKKKLFLKIIKNISNNLNEKNLKEIINLVRDSNSILNLQDILPYINENTIIDYLKKDICSLLGIYHLKIQAKKEEIKENLQTIDLLNGDLNSLRKKYLLLDKNDICYICKKTIFYKKFYVFSCKHYFHSTCALNIYLNSKPKDELFQFFCTLHNYKNALINRNEKDLLRYETKIDDILTEECFLCGSISISSISQHFISQSEGDLVDSWAISKE
ncbi:hypothetical protein C922_00472 [Plasmodium inui San Antonio 1]|uniref:Uncharacterized protein n=1 Tax=Plasmodium inui San Antonio 1 TaxID=1237626 RepID=W7AIE0_9APIC|nr:hypothetical protein C922_00472 [Plasmodium inui San Antonio 1]EUD68784.1 hypothetical protein C922_00472 [Plasmodium inui San Antonio 1]